MKRKSIILLSSLFLLAGCTATPSNSSSSSPVPQPSSSSPTSVASSSTSSASSTISTIPSTSSTTSSTSSSSSTSTSTKPSTSSTVSTPTSSSSSSSVNTSLVNKKAEINSYLDSLSLENYREAEQETLKSLLVNIRAIVEESTDVDELDAALASFKTQVETLKTKAQYEKEEAEALAKQLAAKKAEVIAKLEIPNPTQYRQEELASLNAIKESLVSQVKACNTVEEVEAVDVSFLTSALTSTKTNAMYTMQEILNYGEDSKWDLVNAHRDQMTLNTDNTITTHDDGFALDSKKYSGDIEVVFSVNGDGYYNLAGILLATQTAVAGGNGLDGYAVNISRGADGHEWLQVYYIKNFYASSGEQYYNYLGGWVLTDDYPGETATNCEFRVKISDGQLKAYKEADYQKYGESAKVCAVDLSVGADGTVHNVYNEYQFGIVTWGNSGVPFNLNLKMLAGSEAISGHTRAVEIVSTYYQGLNLDKYDETTKAGIVSKYNEIMSGEDDKTYDEILSGLAELKVLVNDADNYLANGAKIRATNLMDAIFSTDKSTMSSWDAVTDHTMNQWVHEKGTNTVTTPTYVSAGWQLSKARYSNIDLTFKIDGCQRSNPYVGINSKTILIGAESAGYYPKGYAVTLFQNESNTEAWVQVHYLDGNGNGGNFVCGICEFIEGASIRVVMEGNLLSIYINGTQREITNLADSKMQWTLPNYNGGSIGILNWDDAQIQSTFTFEEFTGTEL